MNVKSQSHDAINTNFIQVGVSYRTDQFEERGFVSRLGRTEGAS
jgi:hypothetical protein